MLEDEIKEKIVLLPGKLEVINDIELIIDDLSDNFEWSGSKIDWTKTKSHETIKLNGDYSNWISEINSFILTKNINDFISRSENIFYINDSSLDFSVKLDLEAFYPFLEMAIKNIPQHHYFYDKRKKWCFVISSEGYADFGFSANA